MDEAERETELETIEIQLLLEGIYRYYGFDFRNYTFPCLRRRIQHRLQAENLPSVSALLDRVLHDSQTMERLFSDFSISVTEMFRDPSFFLFLRTKVLPLLQELPHIRIWQAGCSSGEESYSLAILLQEEGLYQKTRIYATDMNDILLEKARQGAFSIEPMQQYTRNYLLSGGEKAFSEYYSVEGDKVWFTPKLTENILFAQHNLATDHSFNEFDLILCRNVLIYFNKQLQNKVHDLFYESLRPSGFLALGSKEGLAFSSRATYYEPLSSEEKVYRKIN